MQVSKYSAFLQTDFIYFSVIFQILFLYNFCKWKMNGQLDIFYVFVQ